MKKRIFLILVIALCAFSISAKPIDVVVMLDTSESVLPIYEKLVNYIVKNVLTNHVRFGDTFHLISFDEKPELIFSRQLKDSNDLEEVVAELFLLNPLGKHTDLVMALKYLNQHVSSLSDSSSSEIIILTDGIHDPPPGSPFQNIIIDGLDGGKINILENEIKNISKSGWSVSLVKLPENGKTVVEDDIEKSSEKNTETFDSSEEQNVDTEGIDKTESSKAINDNLEKQDTPVTSPLADKNVKTENNNISSENNIFSFTEKSSSKIYQTEFNGDAEEDNNAATGSPRITYPSEIGKIKYHFSIPLEIENYFNKPILLKLDKVQFENNDILKTKLNIRLNEKQKKNVKIDLQLPYTVEPGKHKLDIKLVFTDNNRAYPDNAVIQVNLVKSLSDFIKDINIIFKIIFLILIAAALVIFFFIFFSSFIHVSVRDTYKIIKKDFEEMVSEKGLRPLALKVIGQNDSRIGTRNIHSFNDKSVKTIGGGHSSYLIFLYKISPHIAELVHHEGRYILKIIKKEYFSDITEDEKEIKMGEIIKIKTEKNMFLECYFYEYISPLEQINNIMKLTDHRGMPENRLSIYSS